MRGWVSPVCVKDTRDLCTEVAVDRCWMSCGGTRLLAGGRRVVVDSPLSLLSPLESTYTTPRMWVYKSSLVPSQQSLLHGFVLLFVLHRVRDQFIPPGPIITVLTAVGVVVVIFILVQLCLHLLLVLNVCCSSHTAAANPPTPSMQSAGSV
jgi:hypothetical protein